MRSTAKEPFLIWNPRSWIVVRILKQNYTVTVQVRYQLLIYLMLTAIWCHSLTKMILSLSLILSYSLRENPNVFKKSLRCKTLGLIIIKNKVTKYYWPILWLPTIFLSCGKLKVLLPWINHNIVISFVPLCTHFFDMIVFK